MAGDEVGGRSVPALTRPPSPLLPLWSFVLVSFVVLCARLLCGPLCYLSFSHRTTSRRPASTSDCDPDPLSDVIARKWLSVSLLTCSSLRGSVGSTARG